MTRPVAGLDGCPGGWLYVREVENGQLVAGIAGDLSAVLEAIPDDTIVATDIPIGLTETGGRACDAAARDLLGWPRRASVFSAPARGVLGIGTYREACDAHRAIDGRGMSRQSFAIMAKIAEVDAVLTTGTAALRERVAEIHPEVSFSLWNGGTAMVHAKKTAAGRAERRRLVDTVWPRAVPRLEIQLGATGRRYGVDDLYDALAALWTARRIRAGSARTFPDEMQVDERGVRMAIVGSSKVTDPPTLDPSGWAYSLTIAGRSLLHMWCWIRHMPSSKR